MQTEIEYEVCKKAYHAMRRAPWMPYRSTEKELRTAREFAACCLPGPIRNEAQARVKRLEGMRPA